MQINLLSPQSVGKTQQGLDKSTKLIALIGFCISLIFLMAAGFLVLLDYQTDSKIAVVQTDLDKLKDIQTEMKAQKQLAKDLAVKESCYNELNKMRPKWTAHLKEIDDLVPVLSYPRTLISFDNTTGMWDLGFVAPNQEVAAQLSARFQASPYFGPGLLYVSELRDDIPEYEFHIGAKTTGGAGK